MGRQPMVLVSQSPVHAIHSKDLPSISTYTSPLSYPFSKSLLASAMEQPVL